MLLPETVPTFTCSERSFKYLPKLRITQAGGHNIGSIDIFYDLPIRLSNHCSSIINQMEQAKHMLNHFDKGNTQHLDCLKGEEQKYQE
mgnify:CR=1 FL=1